MGSVLTTAEDGTSSFSALTVWGARRIAGLLLAAFVAGRKVRD